MIDEKKLIEEIKNSKTVIKGSEMLEYFLDCIIKEVHSSVIAIIKQQSKVGEWIPVNEGLPEEMKEVPVWFEYYRYGDYNRLYQTMGIGYVIDGKWSYFVNGTSGWKDLRIIAWMDVDPYRKEEE